jgi:hypothetical protein
VAVIDNDGPSVRLEPASRVERGALPAALRPTRRVRLRPPARAALFTGAYIMLLGCALIAAPATVFGLLFDARCTPTAPNQ